MTDRHLDLDTLAELAEDLLDADTARRARTHLEACATCADELTALATVPALLAGAAAVGPAPEDVARRWDRALADAAGAGEASVTPLPDRTRAPRGMRLLQAAAVVVLLLAGGAVGVSALRGGGGSGGSAGSASSAGGAQAPDTAKSGFPLTASGRDWSKASVVAAVPQLLDGAVGPAVPERNQASADGGGTGGAAPQLAGVPAARLAEGPALADCVTALTDGPATPLAVDLAEFEGRPAAVVLLPGLAGPGSVDVWVVGAGCGQQRQADLLYYAAATRP